MSKNNSGNYEEINKLKCYKCPSTNIIFIETTERINDKIGLETGFVIGRRRIIKAGIYHCLDCNRLMAYPIAYVEDTNQKSTTKKNTQRLNGTQNT
ncbi:MAG: hypothetical protein ACREA3_01020 [Nitrosotalea sp.]